MKRLFQVIGIMLAFYHVSAQQNDTAQLILSDAKNIPDQAATNGSSLRTTPALHSLTHSKQTSNVSLPVDAMALPPKGTVVPGHKKEKLINDK